jgi:hypothetical protein
LGVHIYSEGHICPDGEIVKINRTETPLGKNPISDHTESKLKDSFEKLNNLEMFTPLISKPLF